MSDLIHIGLILRRVLGGILRRAEELIMELLHPDDIVHLSEEDQQAAIDRQRRELGVKPWEFCPLEVDDGRSSYPPGTAGHESWNAAQRLRAQLAKPRSRCWTPR